MKLNNKAQEERETIVKRAIESVNSTSAGMIKIAVEHAYNMGYMQGETDKMDELRDAPKKIDVLTLKIGGHSVWKDIKI